MDPGPNQSYTKGFRAQTMFLSTSEVVVVASRPESGPAPGRVRNPTPPGTICHQIGRNVCVENPGFVQRRILEWGLSTQKQVVVTFILSDASPHSSPGALSQSDFPGSPRYCVLFWSRDREISRSCQKSLCSNSQSLSSPNELGYILWKERVVQTEAFHKPGQKQF